MEITAQEFWGTYKLLHLFFFVSTCVVGFGRKNSGGAMVLAIFFPVIAFIVVLFLKKKGSTRGPSFVRPGGTEAAGLRAEDPMVKWEREQRMAQGVIRKPERGEE